jgi:hypothetical protein
MLVATKPDADLASFFLSDGASLTEVYSQYNTQHDRYAVDETGLLVYREDRRFDGWAKSNLRSCSFGAPAGQPLACVDYADADLNGIGNIALTPTRALVVHAFSVVSYDRHTLKDPGNAAIATREGSVDLLPVGSHLLAAGDSESGLDNGKWAFHTPYFSNSGSGLGSGTVNGVIRDWTADTRHAFLATVGEGDVTVRAKTGVIARVNPTAKKNMVTLATSQDAYSVALAGNQVYWIDAPKLSGDAPTGVVRFTTK